MSGSVISIQLCVGHRDAMKSVESARMIENYGIEGDRHAVSEGIRTKRQVLLTDEETLAKFGLSRGDIRENITTTGIEIHSLKEGDRVSLGGDAVVEITGHCAPCARMDEIRDGLRVALEGNRGMLATVISGGTVNVGDEVRALQPALV